jgi:aldehyde:ferredoxin oxidoreductase
MVKAACVITDLEKAAGRCGLGAVMGAKKLKAIAVRGTGSIEIAEPELFKRAVEDVLRKLSKSEYLQRRGEVGIYGQALWGQNFRETAWRNYQGGYAPDSEQTAGIHPDVFYKMKQKSISCFSCPIHCRQLHRIPDGPLSEGLEANDILNFGAKLNIFDASIILKIRALCNQYGLDVDNTAGVIAWAFECYQRGIINEEDTAGLKLNWGNHEVIIELIRKMTYREGFGNILTEGSKKASEIIGRGSEVYSINIKGQELMETIWSDKGWAFGTVVAPRGGTHTRGAIFSPRFAGISPEISQKYYGVKTIAIPTTYEGKVELVVLFERIQAVADSLGLCAFATIAMAPAPNAITSNDIAALYSAATGWEIDDKELLTAGERIHNLEKAFNVLHTNWTRQDDYPPAKFTQEPIKMPGTLKGEFLNIDKWDEMLDEYYTLHGWDTEIGYPTRKVLEKLDLKDIADVLQKTGKLPQETA